MRLVEGARVGRYDVLSSVGPGGGPLPLEDARCRHLVCSMRAVHDSRHSPAVDAALHRRAKATSKSLNQGALEARGAERTTAVLEAAELRRQSTPIPTSDMWIAAIVLQHDLALHARDTQFDHLPQIVRV